MVVHNLPHYTTPFVGRITEITEVASRLKDSHCGLLTLVGPGGIGKTRLALQVALNHAGQFVDGISFVLLQPLTSADFIVSAIAETVGCQFYSGLDSKQQLLNFLHDKALLLVLDNFEHLLSGSELLTEIVVAAPQVRILVTSRERLNLMEECVFEVRELNYPISEAETDIEAYDAVQLFVQHARRVKADFALTSIQKPAVIRICRLVGGMPLAIELAAAWVRALSSDEITHEIERSLNFLESPTRNIASRHRTIRTAFEPTWARLTKDERHVFMSLSIFRGGFTRDAAEYVAVASLRTLSALLDRSLIRMDQNGRYDLHELLRQYAEERLLEIPYQSNEVRERHCHYYMDFVERQWLRLTGSMMKPATREVSVELENIRTAWDWAVEQNQAQEIEAALNSLWFFFDKEARAQEGIQLFGKAADALKTAAPEQMHLWAKVLVRQGALYFSMQLIDQSEALLKESITLLRQFEAGSDLAFALLQLWFVNGKEGYATGIAYLNESLTLYTKLGDKWGMGQAFYLLCYSHLEKGIPEEAWDVLKHSQQYAEACLAVYQELDNPYGIAVALRCLGNADYWLREYQRAHECYQKSLKLFQDVGIPDGILYALRGLGVSACALGKYADARRFVLQALQYMIDHRLTEAGFYAVTQLCVVAEIWLEEGETERAHELLSLVDQENQKAGMSRNHMYLHTLFRLDDDLPPHLSAAAKRGRTMDFDTMLSSIIDDLTRSENVEDPPADQGALGLLTERELEILQLIAHGWSNRQIAEELIFTVGTVKWYVHQIHSKLEVGSRTQAIARARELKLL